MSRPLIQQRDANDHHAEPSEGETTPESCTMETRTDTEDVPQEQAADVENGPTEVDFAKLPTGESHDPNIVDWDGPDDPNNPVNWSMKKKVAATVVISSITFVT